VCAFLLVCSLFAILVNEVCLLCLCAVDRCPCRWSETTALSTQQASLSPTHRSRVRAHTAVRSGISRPHCTAYVRTTRTQTSSLRPDSSTAPELSGVRLKHSQTEAHSCDGTFLFQCRLGSTCPTRGLHNLQNSSTCLY